MCACSSKNMPSCGKVPIALCAGSIGLSVISYLWYSIGVNAWTDLGPEEWLKGGNAACPEEYQPPWGASKDFAVAPNQTSASAPGLNRHIVLLYKTSDANCDTLVENVKVRGCTTKDDDSSCSDLELDRKGRCSTPASDKFTGLTKVGIVHDLTLEGEPGLVEFHVKSEAVGLYVMDLGMFVMLDSGGEYLLALWSMGFTTLAIIGVMNCLGTILCCCACCVCIATPAESTAAAQEPMHMEML